MPTGDDDTVSSNRVNERLNQSRMGRSIPRGMVLAVEAVVPAKPRRALPLDDSEERDEEFARLLRFSYLVSDFQIRHGHEANPDAIGREDTVSAPAERSQVAWRPARSKPDRPVHAATFPVH